MPDIDCLSVGILVADYGCAPIAHVPAAGELLLTESLSLSIGGCASNVAVDLARQEVRVGAVGYVGDDIFGRFVTETLEAARVDTRSVRRLAGVGTSGTLIINVAGQDRRFIHTFGANARFTAADIPLEHVRAARVLYVGGYLLMPALDGRGPGRCVSPGPCLGRDHRARRGRARSGRLLAALGPPAAAHRRVPAQ